MKFKPIHVRPKLAGRAAFKTLLKRQGYNVPRDFYGASCCILRKGGRYYRFRFEAGVVDVSCPRNDFDRWANSTERTERIKCMKVRLSPTAEEAPF